MSPSRSQASQASTQRGVVSRTAEELLAQIRSGALTAGARLPSVRQLARDRKISPFSAAEIYNALVATGAVEALAGHGYFVARRRNERAVEGLPREFPADSVWERRREALDRPIKVDAGCGWLPAAWLHGDGVRAALRSVARRPDLHLEGYGSPLGLGELRAHLSTLLEARKLIAREDQIVLTQGASQALDLIVRECLKPGDAAVVEDPAYPPIFELLKDRGVQVLTIARTENGPDVDALAILLKRRRVRCLFTNTTCHNPTGTTTSLPVAHRLLELANRHDFLLVEDDIFVDLAPHSNATLASVDELRRVIYLSSFSKTISPSLRAGYLVAAPALAQKLARAKVMTSLGSSELLEQLLLQILMHGHYRRHLKRLRDRLASAHAHVAREFDARGVELAFRPESGLFVWAKLPSRESVSKLWRLALRADVLLAPGELFRPDGSATAYWRFNVAQCDSRELFRFLDGL
jgi:DNA-binding transcriptional MocR family regulator